MINLKEAVNRTSHPKLQSYAQSLYLPIVKGGLLSMVPAALVLFVIPFVAVSSLIGANSFQPSWDPAQLTDSDARKILYGRRGLMLVSIGRSHL